MEYTTRSGVYSFADGSWSLASRLIVGFVFGVIIFAGLFGNSMVIAAIARQRKFHTRGNYLIGSLAGADLLVCLLVAPYSALMTLYEFGPQSGRAWWLPSNATCQVFLFFDVACCTASILHLCVIAYDRYAVITKLRFQAKTTFLRVMPYIVAIWSAAALLSLAPHLVFPTKGYDVTKTGQSNDHIRPTRAPAETVNVTTYQISETTQEVSQAEPVSYERLLCVVNTNKVYRVMATTIAFYAPLSIIVFIYWRVFRIAWRRVHKSPLERGVLSMAQHLGESISQLSTSENHFGGNKNNNNNSISQSSNQWRPTFLSVAGRKISSLPGMFCKSRGDDDVFEAEKASNSLLPAFPCTLCEALRREKETSPVVDQSQAREAVNPTNQGQVTEADEVDLLLKRTSIRRSRADSIQYTRKRLTIGYPGTSFSAAGLSSVQRTRARLRLRRERKIIKTVGMVIGAFVICWLPFFLKELIFPFCLNCFLPPPAEVFINWLGYANSALNPFIYAYSNDDFNKAFKRLLRDLRGWLTCAT